MKKGNSKSGEIRKDTIKLHNSVYWDPKAGDKVYLDDAQIAIDSLRFEMRQVLLRLTGGPALDFCFVDMDRLVVAYLKLRGIKAPRKLEALAKSAAPLRCDFIVPSRLLPKPPTSRK